MNSEKKFKSRVISISAGHFLHDVYSSFLAPMLPLLIEKLGISLSLAGLLDVIRRIPSLANPLIGIIADRADVRYMVIVTPAITGIAMSFIGLSPNYPTLAILLFVAGLSAAFFHVPSPVLIKKFSKGETAQGMGYYMFGGEIARTLGPLLITAAISWWGLEGSYRVLPISLVASVILYVNLRKVKHVKTEKPKRSSPDAATKRLKRKKYIPLFTGISGYLFFNAGMKAFLTLYLVVYLTGKGNSLWVSSISLSVLQLAGAAGSFFSGHISNRLRYRGTLMLSSIVSPILVLGLYFFSNLTIPFLVLFGLSFFIAPPVMMAIVQEQSTSRPAFLNSIYMTISFVVNSIMVLLVGALSDRIGLSTTLLITAIMAFGSIGFVFLFPEKKKVY
ncbi:MAG: MFS transporter [Bacteroidales bacterium]|jgi:FSR family fosmidomycin resistance protein-like MFS transporter|nr:MFS transporter [Bacteroidales bacterium]MDD4672517.1 MFS transporter [Bacteroidales bacterium]MDY0349149.1 MFS transporter [Tenuifilaceae bacterium]